MDFDSPPRSSYLRSYPALPRRRALIDRAETRALIALTLARYGEPQRPQADGIPPEIAPCPATAEAAMEKDGTGDRSQPTTPPFKRRAGPEPRLGVPTAEAAATTETVPPESVRRCEMRRTDSEMRETFRQPPEGESLPEPSPSGSFADLHGV